MDRCFELRFDPPLRVHTTNAALLNAYMHATVQKCDPEVLMLFGINQPVLGARIADLKSPKLYEVMATAFPEQALDDPIELGVNSGVHAEPLNAVLDPRFLSDGCWVSGCVMTIRPITSPFMCEVH